MTLDLTHLEPGMIVAVTIDGETTFPTDAAEIREERGVGLYAGPILVRLPNGQPAPGILAVEVEDDPDPEVEALARGIADAFCKNAWADMSPTARHNYRVAAGNLIAEGWRRNQPETVEVFRDCFDDVSDDDLDQVAERPDAAPVSLVMSVASRRARKALELRRAHHTEERHDDTGEPDVQVSILECAPGLFRELSREVRSVNEHLARRYSDLLGGDA